MLKVRIIPTLLYKDYGLVKGVGFDSWRRIGSVLPAIKVYTMRMVDELIFLDIAATPQDREPDYMGIADFSSECFVPLTVGGGIKTIEHIRKILKAGADKVSLNSAALLNPHLISEAAGLFGSQCIVVSIDVRKRCDGTYECYTHSGSSATGRLAVDWAREAARLGAGELLITSIEKDGSMRGYDLELIKQVTSCVSIPVIASGGAGNYHDFYEAISLSGASALAAASIFHFTEQTPLAAKEYLAKKGISVRLNGLMPS